MVLKVYNTLSGKKERLIKPKGRPLRLFVCGPTVYDYSHLGHARTYLAFDIIVRYLNFQGFKVFYIQNITNIDDKIINRAKRLKKQPLALANFFEKKFYEDMKNLKITSVDKYARASDFIPQIIKQIQTLIKKGHAYKIEGDGYYFDLQKPDKLRNTAKMIKNNQPCKAEVNGKATIVELITGKDKENPNDNPDGYHHETGRNEDHWKKK